MKPRRDHRVLKALLVLSAILAFVLFVVLFLISRLGFFGAVGFVTCWWILRKLGNKIELRWKS